MRFVHVADVHLDTSFSGRSDRVRRRLREASRDAFRRAVDLAVREDAHAFLVAGDLFDGDRLSFTTERFLLEQARRLDDHGITMVYATGNHDPGAPDAGPRPIDWPACVHVAADGMPNRILVPDRTGEPVGFVTAVGHATDRETADLSRRFPRPETDLPHVALLHTQVHSSPGSEHHHAYAPSELRVLVASGYDYWALGHVHQRSVLSEDPPILYAGSLQGRTHADQGERGAVLVDLAHRTSPAISFRPLAPVRWETLVVERLDGATSLDTLERHVQLAWRSRRDADPGARDTEWMVRVVLRGPCRLWSELRHQESLDVMADELTSLLGALDVVVVADEVHPVVAVDEHRRRTDVLGEALRMVREIRDGDLRLELDPGELVGVSSDDPAAVAAYVRDLLDGAEGEVASRLLSGGDGS